MTYIENGGWGGALAAETPVLTASGWRTAGDLYPGCELFDERGLPARVVSVFDAIPSVDCYKINFDDGSDLITDGDCLWHTFTHADRAALVKRSDAYRARRRASRPSRAGRGVRARPDVAARNALPSYRPSRLPPPDGEARTTREVLATLVVSNGRQRNHSVPLVNQLSLPTATLPTDPYTLGVWLGDGSSGSIGLTCADPEIVAAVRHAGYDVRKWGDSNGTRPYAWGINGLLPGLRQAGVLKNKHIPTSYLLADPPQRLALLQGLMDTDGTADVDGGVEFTSTLKELAEGTYVLAASLGVKPTLREGRATLAGVDHGVKYRVKWTATLPCFRLRRKQDRLPTKVRATQTWRYITDVRSVAATPLRHVSVASPTGAFVVGKSFIPIHRAYPRWLLTAVPRRG